MILGMMTWGIMEYFAMTHQYCLALSQQKLKCRHCEREFLSRQGRQRHETRTHLGAVRYRCAVCHKQFHLLEWFKKHSKVYRHRMNVRTCRHLISTYM